MREIIRPTPCAVKRLFLNCQKVSRCTAHDLTLTRSRIFYLRPQRASAETHHARSVLAVRSKIAFRPKNALGGAVGSVPKRTSGGLDLAESGAWRERGLHT